MEHKKQDYKKQGNQGLFDREENAERPIKVGNPLEKLSKVIDFEMFIGTLETRLYKEKFTGVGAKPYDYVVMFKILVLQKMYHLCDEQVEYQMIDRSSFRNFLSFSSGDKIPDARTFWKFKEHLTQKNYSTDYSIILISY